jgi:integrase
MQPMLVRPRLRGQRNKKGIVHYYFDLGGSPRRWEPLGTEQASVLKRYDKLIAQFKERVATRDNFTVDAMLGDYIEHANNVKTGKPLGKGTLANYRSFRKNLSKVFGPAAPDSEEMTQAAIVRYMRTRKASSPIIRGEVALLSLSYLRWMDLGKVQFNPCFGVKVKLPPCKRTRLLRAEEVDRIVQQADERLAVAIELAFATGLRIGDMCRLRWADVGDLVETQKTGQRLAWTRTDEFDALLARAKALHGKVASMFVLMGPRHRPWTTYTLREHWYKACGAAGIEDAHWHDIRAAAATEIERRDGIEAASRFLGHRNLSTTQVYLRDRSVRMVTPLARNSKRRAA